MNTKTASKPKTPGTETLAYKQSILQGLVTTIRLNERMLVPDEKATIDRLENSLTFNIKALVERSKHEEIDLKIASMREVIAVLKGLSVL